MKILHAPINIANIGWLLSRGQIALGHEAEMHNNRNSYMAFSCDRQLDFNSGTRRERLIRIFRYLADVIEQEFDVFHFYYYATLMPKSYRIPPFADVEILRGIGKKIFFHLVGCDCRLPALSFAENPDSHCLTCPSRQKCMEADKLENLLHVLRGANGVILNGAHRKLFLPGVQTNVLPVPVDTEALTAGADQRKIPKLVHMPSNRGIKGTPWILAVIRQLRQEGVNFEFELVEKLAHDDAMTRLRAADILVDQIGGDIYGTAATEAMAMGRVVLTGIRKPFMSQLGMESPVIPITRETLADQLRQCVEDHKGRRRLSEKSRKYAEKVHSHIKVAKRAVKIYENPKPPVPRGRTAEQIVQDIRKRNDELTPAFQAAADAAAAPVDGSAGAGGPSATEKNKGQT